LLKHLWFDLVIFDNAALAERILGKPIHPEVMLIDAVDKLDSLASHTVLRNWQQGQAIQGAKSGSTVPSEMALVIEPYTV